MDAEQLMEKAADLPRIETEPRLSHAEQRRFFCWLRDQAQDNAGLYLSLRDDFPSAAEPYEKRASAYLIAAQRVFPLIRAGDSVSIEDILQGRMPEEQER